jgi:hypothetical protein
MSYISPPYLSSWFVYIFIKFVISFIGIVLGVSVYTRLGSVAGW